MLKIITTNGDFFHIAWIAATQIPLCTGHQSGVGRHLELVWCNVPKRFLSQSGTLPVPLPRYALDQEAEPGTKHR